MHGMISIVIPAFNEERNITRCLDSLALQDTTEAFEVIVVDNGSTDDTRSVAEGYAGRLNIRVLDEPKRGRGAARAAGFAAASGDVIFSTDADTVVPPHWIETFLAILEERPHVVAVTSFPRIEDCSRYRNAVLNFVIPAFIRMNVIWIRTPGLSGFSFAIRKEAYLASGGFNPESDAYEDLELALRIKKKKVGKIHFAAGAPVVMSGRRFRKGVIKGWTEYIVTFARKFYAGKERVILEVVEEEYEEEPAVRN